MGRPLPPDAIFEAIDCPFAPSPDCIAWIRENFIQSSGALHNEDHAHLETALIGVLWSAKGYARHMKGVAGQAEIPFFQGNAWTRGRQEQQMAEWFGVIPDFVLTFDAHFAGSCTDREWCRLVEHELYHCGQKMDVYGGPKFKKDGSPAFGIRGHDIEEFVGVVRRHGATEAVRELINAAGPAEVDDLSVNGACGTCRALV